MQRSECLWDHQDIYCINCETLNPEEVVPDLINFTVRYTREEIDGSIVKGFTDVRAYYQEGAIMFVKNKVLQKMVDDFEDDTVSFEIVSATPSEPQDYVGYRSSL